MVTRLRQMITAPPFLDEDKTRVAALLTTILGVSLAVCVGYAAITLLLDLRTAYLVFLSGVCVALAALLAAVRRGHVVAVSWLFSIGTCAGLMLAVYAFGGVRSSSYGALILAVIITGILVSGRAAALVAIAGIGFGWVMMQVELVGWYQPNPVDLSLFDAWIGQVQIRIT